MKHHLTRALVVLAVPALLIPAVASSADAAPKPPAVPALAAVVKIYPHLKGGSVEATTEKTVKMPRKDCGEGAVIPGAIGRDAMYAPKLDSMDDLDGITGAAPMIDVTVVKLPSVKVAKQYVRGVMTEGDDCQENDDPTTKVKRFHVKLGNESWGVQVRMGSGDNLMIMNGVFVRSGKQMVFATSMSMHGTEAPSIPKTIKVTKLALKTAH